MKKKTKKIIKGTMWTSGDQLATFRQEGIEMMKTEVGARSYLCYAPDTPVKIRDS